jgi:hypothetical protein
LLLRCLAICLLALGFARPFFQKPMAAAPATSTGAQVVLVVYTSASMRRQNLWPDALAKAADALKNTTAADQVAVLTFDDQIRTLVSFEQWNAMNVSERAALTAQQLAGLKPTWRSAQLGNALIAAADALEDAGKRDPHFGPRRIILISDLHEGSRLDGLQGHDWPRGLEVTLEPVKAGRPTNAGIQWVAETDDFTGSAADAPVRLRVSNSADATREQFQVRWDGTAGGASLDAYVPPGQNRIVTAPAPPAGFTEGRISLSGDDDDFDNSAYIVQPKTEELNVLYLGDDATNDSSQLLYYLKRAFQDTRHQIVRINSLKPSAPMAAANLATNRLLIISNLLPEDQVAEIRQFAADGGTVLFVMNDAASAKTLGELAGHPEVSATEAAVANFAMFGEINFQHPLFAPFADPRFSDFTKVRFWKHRSLALENLPAARVIAQFDDHDPAILEIPAGRGRVFAFTFSWRPGDSQFALSSKFVPLLYSVLDQAGGVKSQPSQYRVGDSVELPALAAASGNGVVSIHKPDGSQVQIAAGETHFSQTDQPGIYEILGAPSPIHFAVNLDPADSKTAPLPADELERLGVPMRPVAVSPAQPLSRQQALRDTELETGQKLWRWLIIAALVVLVLETWLAGRITRRAAARVEAAA